MKKYRRLLVILILSIITIFALLRLGDIDLSAETPRHVNWSWLLLAFIIFYSSVLVRGLRWQRILKTMGWPINYGYVQTLMMAGLFISMILPARVGDVGRVAMLKQDHKIPIAQSIASIAIERALDVFSILVLAIMGAIWALQGRIPPEYTRLMIAVAILFVLGLIGLLAIPSFEGWLRRPGRLEAMVPATIWSLYQKALDFGFNLIHSVRALGQHPFALSLVLVKSLYIWLCDSLLIYFVLISIGAASPLSVSLFAGMLSDLVAAVPITPGALGQFDFTLRGLLMLFDLTSTQSSLTVLLLRFVSLWSFLLIGGAVTYIFGFSRALNLNGQAASTNKALSTAASTPNPTEATVQ
jgi:uncharacterized protein (TIRG00374 family)